MCLFDDLNIDLGPCRRPPLGPIGAAVAGAVSAASILIVCGYSHVIENQAITLFCLSLAMLLAGTVLLYRRGCHTYAIGMLAVIVTLVVLSCLPWYVVHWTPRGGQTHRHSIWELGHVH